MRLKAEKLAKLDLSSGPRECPGCQRSFLPWRRAGCQYHCSVGCCRKTQCLGAKPVQKGSDAPCKVCGRKKLHFERFAPCSEVCHKVYYESDRKTICTKHLPTLKERIHVGYCRLECYNSWDYGSRERALGTQRVWEWKNQDWRRTQRREKKERGS